MAQNLENAQLAVNGQAPNATNNTVAGINLNSNAMRILKEANLRLQQGQGIVHESKDLKENQETKDVREYIETKQKKEGMTKGVVSTKRSIISDLTPGLQSYLCLNAGHLFQLSDSINISSYGFTPLLHLIHRPQENPPFDYIEELLNLPDIELHHTFIWRESEFTALSWLIMEYTRYNEISLGDPSKKEFVEKYFKLIQKIIFLCPQLAQHNPHYPDSDLDAVARHGDLRCLKLMLQTGCNVDLVNRDGTTPLFNAAVLGNLENCQFLIDSKANIDAGYTEHGGNALHDVAYIAESAEVAAFLLVSGFKYNLGNKYGATPFSITQSNPTQYPQYVREIIDNYFSDVESVQTSLNNRRQISEMLQAIDHFFNAVARGDIKTAQEFLAAGIPVNARNMQGRTALHIACQANLPAMTRLLIQNNAKLTLLDDENQTPLDLAALTHLQNTTANENQTHSDNALQYQSTSIGFLMNFIQKMIDAKVLNLKQHLWVCAGKKFDVLPNDMIENTFIYCEKLSQFAMTPEGRSFILRGVEKASRSKEIHLLSVRGYDAWHEKVYLSTPSDQTLWLKTYRFKRAQRLLELRPSENPNASISAQNATP